MSYEAHDKSSSGGLFGIAAIALVAMGLLAFGYNSNNTTTVADGSSTPKTTSMPAPEGQTTGAATRAPSSPTGNQPKNPAPDTRDAPTASGAGVGADNGGPAKAPDNSADKQ